MEETTPMQPEQNEELQNNAQETVVETIVEEPHTDNQPKEEPVPAAEETPAAEEAPAAEAPEEAQEAAAPAAETEEKQEAEAPAVDLNSMDREGLLAVLQELMTEEIQAIKGRATALRARFNELNKEVQKKAFDTFVAEGGNKEEYEAQNDSVAEAFYRLYDQYRERRQKYLADLEVQKQKNYEAKQALIEELRTLIDSEEE